MLTRSLEETNAKVATGGVSIMQMPGIGSFNVHDIVIKGGRSYCKEDFPAGCIDIDGRLWDVTYKILSNQTLIVVFRGLGADIRACEMTNYCNHFFGAKPAQVEKIDWKKMNAKGDKSGEAPTGYTSPCHS